MFFKTKDLMTVGNVGGGLACVLVAMEGMGAVAAAALAARADVAQTYVFWSGFCIMVALFFDVFDGKVARLLGQMNQFGAEFVLVDWKEQLDPLVEVPGHDVGGADVVFR